MPVNDKCMTPPKVILIRLPVIPPSFNRVAGRNEWEYREQKKRITEHVRLLALQHRPKTPIDKAEVTIRYYFPDARRRDPDNYSGKFLLDGLTKAGIIADDSFQHIALKLEAEIDKKNPRTELWIKEAQ